MYNNDIPSEYMNCFNIVDEIPDFDPMEVERSRQEDLYETTSLEWHEWQPGIQELLDLVIEQGMSARQAGLTVGIVVRTAQHYVKQYKDDDEKRLPGFKNPARSGGNNRKLDAKHTDFLCNYYDGKPTAVLWEARDSLLSAFPDIKSITLAALHKHLVLHASFTLKKLEKIVDSRTSEATLNKRREKVLEWREIKEMDWLGNCVFIDEAGFDMHISEGILVDQSEDCQQRV
ncbi:hypothetical protein BD770DRAFT_472330 [Pilaira anomala]|nr:hypothetical protein BD770DRAFT_472330 [Pilaira anomala]